MPNSLELANRILRREKELCPLYNQLSSQLTERRYLRAAQNLRNLQNRQIEILSDLV